MNTLAVKYRPSTFDDVVEQDAIKVILQEQIRTETFKNAYLFCGPAGCGKTTAARIFAAELNKRKGNPIEVDAASNNGVDNVRTIIEDARRRSLDSDYKVFIIDECHMLSIGAWNAFLKLLEEPPKGTVFLMCTTDPQKIPATILSRVQRYNFSKISLDKIVERLNYILVEENAEIWQTVAVEDIPTSEYHWETRAIDYIAKLADGGMRDAITMMDKCVSYNNEITLENVVKALGTVDYADHFELLYALTTGSEPTAIRRIETVYNAGKDIKQFIKQFQYFVVDVLKCKMFGSFQYSSIPALDEYKTKIHDTDYDLCLDTLEWVRQLNTEVKWESNVRLMIEASIIIFCDEEAAKYGN